MDRYLRVPLMLADKRSQPRETEHLAFGVVSLYQPVAVEQCCLASLDDDLHLLVADAGHESQGYLCKPRRSAELTEKFAFLCGLSAELITLSRTSCRPEGPGDLGRGGLRPHSRQVRRGRALRSRSPRSSSAEN